MSTRAVVAALAEYANKPSTAHDVRTEPGDTFGQSPFVALNEFLRTIDSRAEFNELVGEVAPLIRAADPFRGSTIAINCGTLTEMGADPELVFPHLLAELPRHLALARRAAERNDPSPTALFDADPDAARAASGLTYLLLATMTVICRAAAYRRALRLNGEIVDGIFAIRDAHREADFVAQVLSLTDDLELLVLVPEERKGFRVALEAVNFNFHLFTLLQAALVSGGHLAGDPPDPELIAVATGEFPAQRRLEDLAQFHFYSWHGLNPDGTFAATRLDTWIPGDASPTEIPPLDGTRIVLLGPRLLGMRSWDSNFFANIHDALRSKAEIVGVLSEAETDEWIDRIRREPR
jgi:hypothetical protein